MRKFKRPGKIRWLNNRMEILNIPFSEKRYVVANKGKILIVTHNRKYAEFLTKVLNKYDWPETYEIKVERSAQQVQPLSN